MSIYPIELVFTPEQLDSLFTDIPTAESTLDNYIRRGVVPVFSEKEDTATYKFPFKMAARLNDAVLQMLIGRGVHVKHMNGIWIEVATSLTDNLAPVTWPNSRIVSYDEEGNEIDSVRRKVDEVTQVIHGTNGKSLVRCRISEFNQNYKNELVETPEVIALYKSVAPSAPLILHKSYYQWLSTNTTQEI